MVGAARSRRGAPNARTRLPPTGGFCNHDRMPDSSPEHPVTDLIAAAPPPARDVLAGWHGRALQLEPSATEGVSYGMPALRYRGRPLVAVATTKTGYSLYPFSPAEIDAALDR